MLCRRSFQHWKKLHLYIFTEKASQQLQTILYSTIGKNNMQLQLSKNGIKMSKIKLQASTMKEKSWSSNMVRLGNK